MSAKINAVNNVSAYLNEMPLEVIAIFEKLAKAVFESPDPKAAVLRAAEEAARDVAFDAAMTAALPAPGGASDGEGAPKLPWG